MIEAFLGCTPLKAGSEIWYFYLIFISFYCFLAVRKHIFFCISYHFFRCWPTSWPKMILMLLSLQSPLCLPFFHSFSILLISSHSYTTPQKKKKKFSLFSTFFSPVIFFPFYTCFFLTKRTICKWVDWFGIKFGWVDPLTYLDWPNPREQVSWVGLVI